MLWQMFRQSEMFTENRSKLWKIDSRDGSTDGGKKTKRKMLCVFENCVSNRQKTSSNPEKGVKFIPFPTTDYSNEQLRRLAKKRLYWWCRTCGVDYTCTLLNQLHVCSRHFVKETCAQLWDIYNPDWIPSLYIPPSRCKRQFPEAFDENSLKEFLKNEELTEESIANPLLDETPDPATRCTELIDELIAYPIGRTYHLLSDDSDIASPYDVRSLPEALKNCLTRSSLVGRMVHEPNAPHYPERMFSNNSNVTPVDLTVEPRWETEKNIMKLQNSVLELMAELDKDG